MISRRSGSGLSVQFLQQSWRLRSTSTGDTVKKVEESCSHQSVVRGPSRPELSADQHLMQEIPLAHIQAM